MVYARHLKCRLRKRVRVRVPPGPPKSMTQETNIPKEHRPLRERSPEYEATLGKINELIDASESEQRTFVKERLESLGKTAKAGELSHVWNAVHNGFLGPKMEIRRNLMVDPFVMDDPDLYGCLFAVLKKFRETPGWKEKPLRSIMPGAVQWTLSSYFGNAVSGSRTEQKNRAFYLDHTSDASQSIHLQELKEKNLAVCAEKGAAAQNLLAFVGLDSDLIATGECRIPADTQEGAHYFILLHAQSGDMIYDPTNPSLVLDEYGKVTSYSPAIYPLTNDQAEKFLAGEPITIEHIDTIIENGERTQKKTQRLYKKPRLQ